MRIVGRGSGRALPAGSGIGHPSARAVSGRRAIAVLTSTGASSSVFPNAEHPGSSGTTAINPRRCRRSRSDIDRASPHPHRVLDAGVDGRGIQFSPPSTIRISSPVRPKRSQTRASIWLSVASISRSRRFCRGIRTMIPSAHESERSQNRGDPVGSTAGTAHPGQQLNVFFVVEVVPKSGTTRRTARTVVPGTDQCCVYADRMEDAGITSSPKVTCVSSENVHNE